MPASTSAAGGQPSATVTGCGARARCASSSARSSASLTRARQPSGVKSRDTAGDKVSAQAMLGQAAHGFSSAIEARDDLAKNIDHLLIGVDS